MGETDSYLEIAASVLRQARIPLSTHQIMKIAFLHGLVPRHLYGTTQHKTLGARLSEDILAHKHKSRFFRTRPGRFFLREFIRDRSLPIEYRTPIVARRRKRELKRSNVACVSVSEITSLRDANHGRIPIAEFSNLISDRRIFYRNIDYAEAESLVPVYSYAIIRNGSHILLHTKSAYAESRKPFTDRLMVGFPTPVCHDDMTLFDMEDHGIVSAGLTGVAIDLDLEFSSELPRFERSASLTSLELVPDKFTGFSLLGIVELLAPAEFEPTNKRLAIGELEWFDPNSPRHRIYDFDPWSQYLIRERPPLMGWGG